MSHSRIWSALTLGLVSTLIACSEDPSRIAGSANADYEGRPPSFNSGCNGVNGSELRGRTPLRPDVASMGDVPPRLEQVIVYGSPIQRPYRGFGSLDSYGGTTQTYIYDRGILDQCSFGTGNTFEVVGPVEDDTLDVPIEAPEGIPQDLWNSLPPRVKKQLREAAWYLADHWIPNDMPELGGLIKEARRAFFFQALANGYNRAQELRADRRRETEMYAYYHDSRYRALSSTELMRADALILGCLTAMSFREHSSWSGQQAEDWASRVIAGWASDATQSYTLRYLEPQLSRLAALGAQFGREGDSCGAVARYHFENRPSELFDPPPGGGGDNPNLF
jgi:hypothetical protein